MDTRCCGIKECKQLYNQHNHTLCETCFRNETRNKMATKQKKIYSKTLQEKYKSMKPLKMTTKKE